MLDPKGHGNGGLDFISGKVEPGDAGFRDPTAGKRASEFRTVFLTPSASLCS